MSVGSILMIAAFILFLLGTIGIPVPPRFNMIAAGLACWSLAVILGNFKM